MIRIILFAAALMSCSYAVFAHGPSRQKVTKEIVVEAPAAEVWAIIENFCAIAEWHPAVHSADCDPSRGTEIGATRILTIGEARGTANSRRITKIRC